MVDPHELYGSPNALAPSYSSFHVSERVLLTGHSHQAWPDCAFEGQKRAWLDAAEKVDAKWERAFEQADRVRQGFGRLFDDDPARVALAASTHELVVRFLSGLPLGARPRLVTTSGEYATIRRQLDRLGEESIEIVRVDALPAATVVDRLIDAVDARTAAVLLSAVYFENAHIVPRLGALLEACRKAGAELLVDAYHALGVIPFSLSAEGLDDAYVVGGGYKYLQLGEGNCCLRLPPHCALRPVITGWFSEFDLMASQGGAKTVAYGAGRARFAGATYDPTSHYRAAAVFDFFDEAGLTPEVLREVSRHQVGVLARLFDRLDADPKTIARDRTVPLDRVAGFLALTTPHAAKLCAALAERGVMADSRGAIMRLGPAPYLSDGQIEEAMAILGEEIAAHGRPKTRKRG